MEWRQFDHLTAPGKRKERRLYLESFEFFESQFLTQVTVQQRIEYQKKLIVTAEDKYFFRGANVDSMEIELKKKIFLEQGKEMKFWIVSKIIFQMQNKTHISFLFATNLESFPLLWGFKENDFKLHKIDAYSRSTHKKLRRSYRIDDDKMVFNTYCI